MGEQAPLSGPDLSAGVDASTIVEGTPLLGHAGGEAIVLVRDGDTVHALGASCSHYGGPLAEGRVFDGDPYTTGPLTEVIEQAADGD